MCSYSMYWDKEYFFSVKEIVVDENFIEITQEELLAELKN